MAAQRMGNKKTVVRGLLSLFAIFGVLVSHSTVCAAQTYGAGTYGSGTYNGSGGADITPPTVAVTAPAAGTVGSTIILTATASDDTAVASIQFKLDTNTLVGSSGVTSPYSLTLDTATVANGSHTIIAVARDSAGNYATSSAVTITVNNSTAAPVFFGGGSGGGGGGGGGTLFYQYGTSLSFMTPINSGLKIQNPLSTPLLSKNSLPPKIKFTQNLILGNKGEQVAWLQIYLNNHGFIIARTGPGSPGKETKTFGFATQVALIKFQKYHALKPPVGYFGPTTRAYVNSTLK